MQSKAKTNNGNKFISQHFFINLLKNRSQSSLDGNKKAKWLVVSSSPPSAVYAYTHGPWTKMFPGMGLGAVF